MPSVEIAGVSLLVIIGMIALDYGTLQQMASLIAHMRNVDRNSVQRLIRINRQYRARVIPGVLCACLLALMPWVYPKHLLWMAVGIIVFGVIYLGIQTVGYLRLLKDLDKAQQ